MNINLLSLLDTCYSKFNGRSFSTSHWPLRQSESLWLSSTYRSTPHRGEGIMGIDFANCNYWPSQLFRVRLRLEKVQGPAKLGPPIPAKTLLLVVYSFSLVACFIFVFKKSFYKCSPTMQRHHQTILWYLIMPPA